MPGLHELLRANVADPDPDHLDVTALLAAGRRRVRRRRVAVLGGSAVLTVVVATVATSLLLTGVGGGHDAGLANRPPAPDAPTLHLAQAAAAREGRDYQTLASQPNRDLAHDNGEYFDGVTTDGLILYQDGPRMGQEYPRLALLDPATGDKDWLPTLNIGQSQFWPVQLTASHLVVVTGDPGHALTAHVFDRSTRSWTDISWPSLPDFQLRIFPIVGPDGRLYVEVPETLSKPPPGGWPRGSNGEADDSNAPGDTYHLYSASLTDPADVRDEHLTLGDLAFTPTAMVWTDSTNGQAGEVHVRDLSTGQVDTFDPHAGARCNLLSFGAAAGRIVMSEFCGTYADGVRDDRVQILTTTGQQVRTIQDNGLDGGLADTGGTNPLVVMTAYGQSQAGTYVYDLSTDRFLRLSDDVTTYPHDGPAPDQQFIWSTPLNGRKGSTFMLSRLLTPAGS